MEKVQMSTKAKTLYALKDNVKKSYIEDMLIIKVKDYYKDRAFVYHCAFKQFQNDLVVVRSSSKKEDNMMNSNAGHFESVLGVRLENSENLYHAIEKVIASYRDDQTDEDESKKKCDREDNLEQDILEEDILIQRQSTNIVMSGVVFTRDIIYNRPYYMIAYDDGSNTDTVTSGSSGKTRWIARNFYREFLDEKFISLIQAVKEIELMFFYIEALDIEFGINQDGKIIIFQVRPLSAVIGKSRPMSDRDFVDAKAYAKCLYLDTNHMLSDTAFLNPAEVIGTNPRPLDYSIYRELITERIWSEGIAPLGYEPVKKELMQKIGNKPYISINHTFLGLTPVGIRESIRFKLYDYYEDILKQNHSTHDKIEHEVILNIFSFTTKKRLEELLEKGFTLDEVDEIRNALYNLTKSIGANFEEISKKDYQSLGELTTIRHNMRAQFPLEQTNVMKLYKYIETLVKSMTEDGTPQFTRQARFAFIAKIFCRTLVEGGYFSQEEIDEFLGSIETMTTDFERDLDKYVHGEMTREDFNHIYGHLRLGTYDIRTDIYKNLKIEIVERMKEKSKTSGENDNSNKTRNNNSTEVKYLDSIRLQKAIDDAGVPISVDVLQSFLVQSIKNREYFKYEFTKSLSLLLDIIIRMGEVIGIAREDMSYLEVQDLLSYHSRDSYLQIISERRNMYHINTYLELPDVIFSVGDIDVIENGESRPNFITNKSVTAEVVFLEDDKDADIAGKIVVVPKADPKYDWIFTKNIAGFVTRHGGAAAHMAIRCAELDIPAALGCGKRIYERISLMTKMELNCGDKKIIER